MPVAEFSKGEAFNMSNPRHLDPNEQERRETNLGQLVLAVLDYQQRGISDPRKIVEALLPEYEDIMPS
jgi:hypothetical protein